MLQIILGFFILCLVLALLGKVLPFALKVLALLVAAALAVVLGVPVAIGVGIEKLTRGRDSIQVVAAATATVGLALSAVLALTGYGWVPGLSLASAKYLIPALLGLAAWKMHRIRQTVEQADYGADLPTAKSEQFYQVLLCATAIWMFPVLLQVVFPALITLVFPHSVMVSWVDVGYCVVASIALIGVIVIEHGYVSILRDMKSVIAANKGALDLTQTIAELGKENTQVRAADVELIVIGTANAARNAGLIEMVELRGHIWLFEKTSHDRAIGEFELHLGSSLRHDRENAKREFLDRLPLPNADAEDYFERYIDFVDQCDFADGEYLVAHLRRSDLNHCVSCGLAEIHNGTPNDEWFCSPICEETEKLCVSIKEKPLEDFLTESAATGFVVIAAGGAWSQNHKVFATGGQGHGFAAEQGNTLIDKMRGKSAKVVGGDNALNGADRLVDGQEIQTKYCSTGARSIGSAFDNKGDGGFRYWDANGEPMPIEVPRDQYAQAVKTMEKKIADNKIPGVTDPARAKDLVIKGSLTYEQAKNITRFGTFESVSYDIAEGSIIAVGAGGISFAITATISYLNTGDARQALRAACLQGGRAFSKTLIVYVGTQQLHRLATVQAAVKIIDVSNLSEPMALALQKSMGVNNTRQLNQALRGTVVASLVVVAVTSGPDLVKMIRGRMSSAQFTKNVAVTAGSTAGGAVGAIAGGALGASFGPVGIWVGKFAGGMVGGALAGAVTNSIAKTLVTEDRELMLAIIQRQVEYLAILFMLTEPEIKNLSANLNAVITPKALETMYGSASRKAFANLLVKPVVVNIIKQRPTLRYDINDVLSSFDGDDEQTVAQNDPVLREAAA
ncbi:hypothetical protein [Alcaligenes sp. CHO6]|uniref:hypothetical protein n=1 Tax=Alcaligenes sp. CHO6 TaxID=3123298 RepID=UPI0030150998